MNNRYVAIGLVNPKSPTNIGGVMRAAGCYKADAVFYSGERANRAMRFQTDTKDVVQRIALTAVDDLLECIPADADVVCVELVEGAISLPQFNHPANAFYVFGPEDGTIPQEIVDRAHSVVYVPTIGCMNLAATVNVLLYDRCAKLGFSADGDELIRQSRDTNNRVKVR
ncbi:MAG: RNA methyltransferase [Thalassolituus sp.]|uniref:RNA methyltransferase n=1 Tax=Thalassolituus TaxID=187492 RepID=UPI002409977A|nr:RNA methyltransferase [Thalassolituus oleivorans]MDF1641936.1 RNA methyltransferase [Thalassolituus oleivorans]